MKRVLGLALVIVLFSSLSVSLDLQEANVMDVQKDGDRFSVTLYHDDSGEEGYADWWQVETMDGERLGRRTLLHAHGTRNFTRSETIEVPSEVKKIVVRGHDQTHGYGGRAAILDPEEEEISYEEQGPDPDKFTEKREREFNDDKNGSKEKEISKRGINDEKRDDKTNLLHKLLGWIFDKIR